jgi:DNA end-binding protein Ku
MGTRERVCAIEIEKSGLVLTTLHLAEEVRDVEQIPHIELPRADPAMLDITEKIVDRQSGAFEPEEFVDRYGEALRAVIEEKKRGRPVKASTPSKDDTKVVDLMAALRDSLKAGGRSAPASEAARRRPARGRKPSRRRVA